MCAYLSTATGENSHARKHNESNAINVQTQTLIQNSVVWAGRRTRGDCRFDLVRVCSSAEARSRENESDQTRSKRGRVAAEVNQGPVQGDASMRHGNSFSQRLLGQSQARNLRR